MRLCVVDGCGEKVTCNGYCNRHNWQVRRYGRILERTTRDPNEIRIREDVAEIVLYNQKREEVATSLIDIEDVERCSSYKWFLDSRGYAASQKNGKSILLHRFIQKTLGDLEVDHVDRDPLNNRKRNLRVVDRSQNNMNSLPPSNNMSGYKGVSWHKRRGKWMAYISKDKKKIYLGYHKRKEDAARAYNKAAKELYGDIAWLNSV